MFGFIKNLITGIMKFITGLLPGKKKNGGYYLELKEEAETAQPVAAAKAAAVSNGRKEPARPVAAAPETSNGAKAPEKAAPEPAKVEMVQTAEGVTVQPKEQAPAVKTLPTETTFAPKYLAPTNTNGRRRPGANMNSFLEMARQVKTPNAK